jgi:putative endonuclease
MLHFFGFPPFLYDLVLYDLVIPTLSLRRGGICFSFAASTVMAFPRAFFVYILASKSRRIYIGMTNSLFRRVVQHKHEKSVFTSRYRINRLVYYERFKYVRDCIARETQLKTWSRAKKLALISSFNPTWEDLAEDWGTTVDLEAWASRFLATPRSVSKKPAVSSSSAAE